MPNLWQKASSIPSKTQNLQTKRKRITIAAKSKRSLFVIFFDNPKIFTCGLRAHVVGYTCFNTNVSKKAKNHHQKTSTHPHTHNIIWKSVDVWICWFVLCLNINIHKTSTLFTKTSTLFEDFILCYIGTSFNSEMIILKLQIQTNPQLFTRNIVNQVILSGTCNFSDILGNLE